MITKFVSSTWPLTIGIAGETTTKQIRGIKIDFSVFVVFGLVDYLQVLYSDVIPHLDSVLKMSLRCSACLRLALNSCSQHTL